jgi:hypothetical protein
LLVEKLSAAKTILYILFCVKGKADCRKFTRHLIAQAIIPRFGRGQSYYANGAEMLGSIHTGHINQTTFVVATAICRLCNDFGLVSTKEGSTSNDTAEDIKQVN